MENLYGNMEGVGEEISILKKDTIHNGVELESITYNNENIEKITLKFTKKADGAIFNFNADILPLKRWDNMDDEAFAKSITNWNSRMKHIATKFDVTEEELKTATGVTSSFSDYASKFIALMTPKLDGRKMHLKIYHNNKGYSTLPQFGPFLEKEVEGVPTNLAFSNYEAKEIRKNSVNTGEEDYLEIDESDELDLG